MFDIGLTRGNRLDIPCTAQFPGDALRHPDDINTSAMAGRQRRPVGRQCRTAGRQVRQPSSRLQAQPRSGAWLTSMVPARHRLACYLLPIYSSSISGRGSRGTVTAVGGGQEKTSL
jgi:hypothetical protein